MFQKCICIVLFVYIHPYLRLWMSLSITSLLLFPFALYFHTYMHLSVRIKTFSPYILTNSPVTVAPASMYIIIPVKNHFDKVNLNRACHPMLRLIISSIRVRFEAGWCVRHPTTCLQRWCILCNKMVLRMCIISLIDFLTEEIEFHHFI